MIGGVLKIWLHQCHEVLKIHKIDKICNYPYFIFQDAHNAILDYDDYSSLFAVYDGHGGEEVAKYTAKKLPNFIKARKDYRMGKLEEGLVEAFVEFDRTLIERDVVRELRVIAGKEADAGMTKWSELIIELIIEALDEHLKNIINYLKVWSWWPKVISLEKC